MTSVWAWQLLLLKSPSSHEAVVGCHFTCCGRSQVSVQLVIYKNKIKLYNPLLPNPSLLKASHQYTYSTPKTKTKKSIWNKEGQ